MKTSLTGVFDALPRGAVGCFNVLNLDMALSVTAAAEEANTPVILGIASRHVPDIDLPRLMPALIRLAETAAVPVALHLDHAGPDQIPLVGEALDLGFTSVMFDGSTLPYAENLERTIRVTGMARSYGASVEAELGAIDGEEGVADTGSAAPRRLPYTAPDEAREFATECGIDALAVAIGTAHGIYRETPHVSIESLATLHQQVPVPLVMHGATGLPDPVIRDAVHHGIRKINYFSGLLQSGMDAVRRQAGRGGNDLLALKRDQSAEWRRCAGDQIRLYAGPMDGPES